MKKMQIDLHLLLPGVPDENDACVNRVIEKMQEQKGIRQVHVISENSRQHPQLCFHYNPDIINIAQVEQLALKAGAFFTRQYGHILVAVVGIRHPRHASQLENHLQQLDGVLVAAVSGTGIIKVEYDKTLNSEENIKSEIVNKGLALKETVVSEKPTDSEKHSHTHDHKHVNIFGINLELFFAILSGFFLAIGFTLSFFSTIAPGVPIVFYVLAYFAGGYFTSKEAFTGISQGKFEIDFLMLVAAIGAAILGEWAEGALLLFLFSLGHSLEHYAMDKARRSIAALTELAPRTALLKVNDDVQETPIENLKAGDVVVVRPNSRIAADGFVVKGSSTVNQAPITGESIPVDKIPVVRGAIDTSNIEQVPAQHRVFAGTINGGAVLEIEVSRVAADSTISRLIKLVNEAQTQKSATQHFTQKLERYYVPAVLILVVTLLFAFLVLDELFSDSFYRAMAVLVAASPCALAISTPSAVLSGVARAARGGVLVKGGRPLEDLGGIHAIAFDKTGTLTLGKPLLTGLYPLNGTNEEELLKLVIAVEKLSDHPLAKAIVNGAMQKLQPVSGEASGMQAIPGRGVTALYQQARVYIGNKELIREQGGSLTAELLTEVQQYEQAGHTTMLVMRDKKLIGIITLMDVARPGARQALDALKKSGIRKMIMLTGDNQQVAEAIAKDMGITEAWGNLLPEQKVKAVEKLMATEKKVAMVGDGVNDAPAMARSTVGIAMGAAGSDVALETADIALMSDKLSNLPFAIGLSKKARQIIRQNIIISLGMVIILVPLTILGIASMGPAVIGHEGSTVLVVFNALRLMAYKN